MALEFISPAFQLQQRDRLPTLKQRTGESLQSFNWEWKKTLEEAYPELPRDQSELIRFYLSNLEDRRVAERVWNKEPSTVMQAMKKVQDAGRASQMLLPQTTLPPNKKAKVAGIRNEQVEGLQQQIHDLTKMVERNQVSVIQDSPKTVECQLCHKSGHLADRCWERLEAEKRTPRPPPTPVERKKPQYCFNCGKMGHFARECRQRRATQGPPPKSLHPKPENVRAGTPFEEAKRCKRCREKGHWSESCIASEPKAPCRKCSGEHWTSDCPRETRENVDSAAASTSKVKTTADHLKLKPLSAQSRDALQRPAERRLSLADPGAPCQWKV